MKKIATALIVGAISLSNIFASPMLYDENGAKADFSSEITGNGYVLRTSEKGEKYMTPYGTIELGSGTVIAFQGYGTEKPSIYLVDGKMRLELSEGTAFTVYTTTSRYTNLKDGAFEIAYTESEDWVRNDSKTEIEIYDSLRGKTTKLEGGAKTDLIKGQYSIKNEEPEATGEIVPIIAEETLTPASPEDKSFLIEDQYEYMGIRLSVKAEREKALLTYSDGVTDADIKNIITMLREKEANKLDGVLYERNSATELNVTYPENVKKEDVEALLPSLYDSVTEYIDSIVASSSVALKFPFSEMFSYMGVDIVTIADKGNCNVFYPEGVKASEVQEIASKIVSAYPAYAKGIIYSVLMDGRLSVIYPDEVSADDVKASLRLIYPVIKDYIDSSSTRSAIPAPPTMKGATRIAETNEGAMAAPSFGPVTRTDEIPAPTGISVTTNESAAPEAVPTEEEGKKPLTISDGRKESEKERKPSFGLLLKMRAVSEDFDDLCIYPSILAEFKSGPWTLRGDINPLKIMAAAKDEYDGSREWANFALAFIDEITYRPFNEKFLFSASRDAELSSDPYSLILSFDSFSLMKETLRVRNTAKVGPFTHSVSISDVSLSENEYYASIGEGMKFNKYPLSFGFGAFVMGPTDKDFLDDTRAYPEAYISLPFYYNESGTEVSLKVSGVMDPWDVSEYGVAVGVPAQIGRFSIEAGAGYSGKNLFRGAYVYGFGNRTTPDDDVVTPFIDLTYSGAKYSFNADYEMLFLAKDLEIVENGDFLSLSVMRKSNAFGFGAGLRVQGMASDVEKAFRDMSQIFAKASFSFENVKANAALYLSDDYTPSLELNGIVSLLGDFGKAEGGISEAEEKQRPFSLGVDFSFTSSKEENDVLRLTPYIGFGGGAYELSLQLPLKLARVKDAIFLDKSAFDDLAFGTSSKTTFDTVYDLVTDSAQIIRRISAGSVVSKAYLIMERDSERDERTFKDMASLLGSSNLSAQAGIMPDVSGVTLFVDNMERPANSEAAIFISPLGLGGPKFTISSAFTFLLSESGDNYYFIAPEVDLAFYCMDMKLSLDLFANTYLSYENDEFSEHLTSYDALEFAAGARGAYKGKKNRIGFSVGALKGKARPYYYDEFTLDRGFGLRDDSFDDISIFASVGTESQIGPVKVEAEYFNASLLDAFDHRSDNLSLGVEYGWKAFTIHANYTAKGILKDIIKGDYDIMDKDTILSLGLSVEASQFKLGGDLFIDSDYGVGKYVNMRSPIDGTYGFGFRISGGVKI